MLITCLAFFALCGASVSSTSPAAGATQLASLPATRPSSQPAEVATGGIPCPKGVFGRGAALAAVDGSGRELPTQCDAVAFWPDGSVKWFFVTALLPPQVCQVNIRPASSQPAATRAAPLVRKVDAGYIVDTGALQFRVAADTGGFIADAALRSEGESIPLLAPVQDRLWQLDYYVADSPGRSSPQAILPTGSIDESNLRIDTVEVERSGPVHATIVLRGRYLHGRLGQSFAHRGSAASEATIRIHAFAGQRYIVLDHTFVYEGNPETDFPARIGLRVPLNLGQRTDRRITAVGGQERVERWMYANPLFATDPPDKPNPGGYFPYWRSGGVVQDAYDHYRTWKLAANDGGPLTMDEGGHCAGWIDISNEDWGCSAGIVDMSENYPTGLEASNEDATITAWLYPPQAVPADLRRYTQVFGTGEAEPHPGKATGLSKTHRLWFYFHTRRDEAAQVPAVADALSGLRLLRAAPSYVASTGVLGPYRAADAAAFPQLEKLASDVTDFMLTHQVHYRWFGTFDYGDFQSVYRFREGNATDNLRWMNDWGRWGWGNDEGMISYWLIWQYLRTGKADYLKAGSAMIAHARDIDVKHTKSYPWGPDPEHYEYRDIRGSGHRHNVNHWGDAYIGPRVANPAAWRLQYYLTGDGRTKDCLEEVYQANVVENKVWPGCDSIPTALYALYAKYEMTGDPRYRRKIEAFLAAYCDFAGKNGHLPEVTPWDFARDRPAGEFTGNGAASFFWHSFGMSNFLIEWEALTGDPKVREALVKQARATLSVKTWEEAYCHFQVLSAGYRLSGDPVLLRRMAELMRPHVTDAPLVPPDREDWIGPNAYLRPKTVSMVGFLMAGLPYVEGAVSEERSLWSTLAQPDMMPATTTSATQRSVE